MSPLVWVSRKYIEGVNGYVVNKADAELKWCGQQKLSICKSENPDRFKSAEGSSRMGNRETRTFEKTSCATASVSSQ